MFFRLTPERDFLLNVELHKGLDIAAPAGDPVRAARSGRVIHVGSDPDGYGRYVIVRHLLGFTSLYGHLASTSVNERSFILRGASLGTVGTTGRTTGPHLHFEVRSYGGTVLPPRVVLTFHSVRRALLGF
jgi:murein DD-endopeptidase MepM/ murein hydrolase activator NlpD